jgi:hypothetical protein
MHRRPALLAVACVVLLGGGFGAVGLAAAHNREPSGAAVRPFTRDDARDVRPTRVPATCRSSQLTVTMGHSFAGLAHAGANIRFTNHSNRTCRLHGWPTLSFQTTPPHATHAQAGDWLGSSFADVTSVGAPTVILKPGQKADAIFKGPDGPTNNTTCPPSFRTVRVTPPGDTRSTTISAWISYLGHFMPACGQIHVSPVPPSAAVYKG